MPVCVVPLSVGALLAVKPKPKPADLLAVLTADLLVVLTTALEAGADTAVNEGMEEEDGLLTAPVSKLEPKLKPADPELKPVNPVKPLNAPVCTAHKTLLQWSSSNLV